MLEHPVYNSCLPLACIGFAAIWDWKGICPFQTSKYTIFEDFYLNFAKNLPKLVRNPPNYTYSAKINFPWLEYEKWFITWWCTVKPGFYQILLDFSRKKNETGSEKPDTRSRKLFVFKHILVKVSKSWKFTQIGWIMP